MKKNVRLLVKITINILVVYLVIHASEEFVHYLSLHIWDAESWIGDFDFHFDVLSVNLEFIPSSRGRWKQGAIIWSLYSKFIPWFCFAGAILCIIICGEYFEIIVAVGWLLLDLGAHHLAHHFDKYWDLFV